MLVVDCLNSGGGGATTLIGCLHSVTSHLKEVRYLLNPSVPITGNDVFVYPKTLPFSRRRDSILAEQFKDSSDGVLLCFGNIPPRRRPHARRIFTYFHNALIIGSLLPKGMPIAEQIRLKLLGHFISRYRYNTDEWFVQTGFIKERFCDYFGVDDSRVAVLPFFSQPQPTLNPLPERDIDFVYVSGASFHKNHRRLFEAWQSLARDFDFHPTLAVTIDRMSADLRRALGSAIESGARIIDFGKISEESARVLLLRSRWCVYPSLVETIGLGLLESAQSGCGILCSNSGYASEIVSNFQEFDPLSSEDIARAVLRTKGLTPTPALPKIQSCARDLLLRLQV